MQIVKVKGEDGKEFQFPDDMTPEQILSVMRNQYQAPNYGDVLRNNSYAAPYEPSLTERIGDTIGGALYDTGLVSDRYGSQRIGGNVSNMLGALPVIGDAMGGDDLGRALKQGDVGGIGMGALAAVPVVGDAVKIKAFRGVGAGSDDSVIEWLTTDRKLAESYAKARGGEVLERDIEPRFTANFNRDVARGRPSSLIAPLITPAVKSGMANIEKAKDARRKFLDYFGGSPISVIDLWKDNESKEATSDLLKSLGYDSIRIVEDGSETIGVIN